MEFSVIIPTYNRVSILRRTLEALRVQTALPQRGYEVIVVDDGSTDETEKLIRDLALTYPVPLQYFYQPNQKQGAARNLGAKHACGERLVFLGDDIVPEIELLSRHLSRHRQTSNPRLAVVGYVAWPQHFKVTRFMGYVGEHGWQFGFSLITDPNDLAFNFFYTSNLSIGREFFLASGGFDCDFREYGWEDMEVALRLKERGMRLVYEPAAVGYHHHPTTLASFVRRQQKVGYSAWTFYRKHPQMEEFLNVESVPRYSHSQRLKMALLTYLCRLSESWSWPDLSSFYPSLMSYHYNLGIDRARNE